MTAINAHSEYNMRDIQVITYEEFQELKKLHDSCEDGGIFKFKGIDVLKDYSKYLIEYLEEEFAKARWS